MAVTFGGSEPTLAVYPVVGFLYVAASFSLSRLLVWVVRRTEWSHSTKGELVIKGRLVLATLAMFGGYSLYLWFPVLEPAFTTPFPDSWQSATLVIEFAIGMGLTALPGVYAVHRGFAPVLESLLERTHSVESHHRRRMWFAAAVFLVGQPTVFTLTILEEVPLHPLSVVPAILAVLTFSYFYLCLPFILVNPFQSRDPTPDERDRIERCYDQFGRSPGKVVLFDGAKRSFLVFDAGRGRHRWTWIRESFFEDATDDELAVVLAHADEKNRQLFSERMIGALILAFMELAVLISLIPFAFQAATLTLLVPATGIVGGLAVAYALLFSARAVNYRADEFACDQLSPDLVSHTYSRYADAICNFPQDSNTSPGNLKKLAPDPTIAGRIERIEERYVLEANTDPSVPSR